MNASTIHEAAAATLAGTMSFPQVVEKLLQAGVEYYHVDYAGHCTRFYDGNATCVVTPIPFDELPAIAPELDVPALRDNIRDSQQNNQPYRDFTRRAMQAGVQAYYAFLRGRRVTYISRAGNQHTEWFPGTNPSQP